QHDRGRLAEPGLAGDELGERPLDRLTVDVAAPRGGEDRDVGTQVVRQRLQDAAPVARRVLVEDGSLGSGEHVDERAAVATRTLAALREMSERVGAEGREVRGEV